MEGFMRQCAIFSLCHVPVQHPVCSLYLENEGHVAGPGVSVLNGYSQERRYTLSQP